MKKQELQKKIKQLNPWYQRICLDGIWTGRKRDVKTTWNKIENSFSIDYKKLRILDLGCNAGYYSVMAAKRGAKVVGVEVGKLPVKQAIFLKDYYEKLWKTKLDITYIHKDISDVDFISLGKFDYIFALAVLYHVGNSKFGKGTLKSFKEQERVISLLTKTTDKLLVRARQRKRTKNEYYNSKYYNNIFKNFGFKPVKTIQEEGGDRSLILYKKR